MTAQNSPVREGLPQPVGWAKRSVPTLFPSSQSPGGHGARVPLPTLRAETRKTAPSPRTRGEGEEKSPMRRFPAMDASRLRRAEVAGQAVIARIVGEAAAEARHDRLEPLGKAGGIGIERAEAPGGGGPPRGGRRASALSAPRRSTAAAACAASAGRSMPMARPPATTSLPPISTRSTAPPFSVNTIWLVALLSGTKLTWSRSSSTRSAL